MKDQEEKKEQLLAELKRLTGLELAIPGERTETGKQTEESIRALRLLCDAARQYSSREAVILRWITGDLKEDNFHAIAAKMHLNLEEDSILYYIELDGKADESVCQMLKQGLADKRGRMVLLLSENAIAVIMPLGKKTAEDRSDLAWDILSLLNTELLRARIAVSHTVHHMDCLPEALRDAEEAMRIGRRYEPGRLIDAADALGEGRLFYGLPSETADAYLNEILPEGFVSGENHAFEGDLLRTAESFLVNDLNIAETARTLHVHRNTLIYRLKKVISEMEYDVEDPYTRTYFTYSIDVLNLYLRKYL